MALKNLLENALQVAILVWARYGRPCRKVLGSIGVVKIHGTQVRCLPKLICIQPVFAVLSQVKCCSLVSSKANQGQRSQDIEFA